MKRITLSAALLLSLAAPAAVHAQTPLPVAPGTRVRISLASGEGPEWVVGNVASAGPDSLVFNPEGPGQRRTLRPGELGAIQISRGRVSPGRNALRVARLAAVAGAVIGAGVGAATYSEEGRSDYSIYNSRKGAALFYGLTGAFPSAVAGAVAGAALSGERWAPATLPAHPVAVGPGPGGGVGVSFSLRL